ncbi:MAG: UUP1 family membrane protein [Candidatus Tectomicrobia bacterium]|nr:UUP1 family membrane protein [Candidatus Tectomicrobia bacterium]
MKRNAAGMVAGVLLLLPALLVTYRIVGLGYPPIPTAPGRTWEVSVRALVRPDARGVLAQLILPQSRGESIVMNEQLTSGVLDAHMVVSEGRRLGVWSGPPSEDEAIIGYQAIIHLPAGRGVTPRLKAPELQTYPPDLPPAERAALERLVARWRRRPPQQRLAAAAQTLGGEWSDVEAAAEDIRQWSSMSAERGPLQAFLLLLRAAELPARQVQGLPLGRSVRSAPLEWVEVWVGKEWARISAESGLPSGRSVQYLPLARDGEEALTVRQGKLLQARWTVRRRPVSNWFLHYERLTRSNRLLDRWSLFTLPEETREAFSVLLLVPIAALFTAALRNLVGFPTFGIFMPVLLAISFRATGLLYGLGLFVGIMLFGYLIRRLLNHLRLLMVPRLSIMLTLVIVALLYLALLGSKLENQQFMSTGLLPIVILTMIIERFYVLLEEAGVREGLRTVAGSAAVSVITYFLIHSDTLQLTFFVYPELLAMVMALQVLLGRYTGFKLLELLRFRPIGAPGRARA